MNIVITFGALLFFVHITWAFINMLSINEGLLLNKLRVLILHCINWLIPIIGPILITKFLTEHVPPHRSKKLASNYAADNFSYGDSGYTCSGSSSCGGGE